MGQTGYADQYQRAGAAMGTVVGVAALRVAGGGARRRAAAWLAPTAGAAPPGATGRAASTDGRSRQRSQNPVPGHPQPRDPHADDRRDGDGRAAAEHAAESAAARLHA